MKIIASIKKAENVRFISHLDVQRILQRTIRRAEIPVAYSHGFNPHPLISFATALALGQTGDCEWIEIRLEEAIDIDEFTRRMNESFPLGLSIAFAAVADDAMPSIATLMVSADYTARTGAVLDKSLLENAISSMLNGEILVKKSKKQHGRKLVDAEVDIRPMVYALEVAGCDENGTVLHISGRQDVAGGLNVSLLLGVLNEKLGISVQWNINRDKVVLNKFN